MNYNIKDKLQEYMKEEFPDIPKYAMMNEFIFYGIFVYYYYFGPIQDSVKNFTILKYIVLIFLLRYFFNYITNITISQEENSKNYFQLNSKLAIFAIIILILSPNEYSSLLIIASYGLFCSAVNDGYTVDNILTVVLILYIHSLNINGLNVNTVE